MTNSRTTRDTLLDDVRRVVVKVGSAVVTTGDGLNCDAINRLADQLAALVNLGLDVVLVSSGAVAAGRQRIFERTSTKSKNNKDMASRQAASAIGQGRLMHDYDEAFARHGKITAQMLLTRSGLKNRERFLNARNTMERLLEWGVIPIVNENDPVSTKELEFGDNDTLGAMCLGLIGADLFINLTSANGVYDQNPDAHPEAKPIPTIDNISALDIEAMCDGKTNVGTGGMYSKLRAARRAAQLGVPTLIVSGRGAFDILNVLRGRRRRHLDPARGQNGLQQEILARLPRQPIRCHPGGQGGGKRPARQGQITPAHRRRRGGRML